MRRTEHRLLGWFGDNFRRRQLKVIVRMLKIADRVLAFGYVDGLVRHHLDVLPVKDAVILLRYHVRDPGLAGVEIVPDLFHVECLAALGHLRHGEAIELRDRRGARTPGVRPGRAGGGGRRRLAGGASPDPAPAGLAPWGGGVRGGRVIV